jgi:nucleotide-binding universal stress UspA family protein
VGRANFGSISKALLGAAAVVLSHAAPSLRRVLCAVDVEREACGALAMASVLAEHFEAQLDGLYVAAPSTGWDSRHQRVRRLIVEHNARDRLETLLAPFEGTVPIDSFIARGRAAEMILAHADAHQSDLIVCGISGNSRLGEGSRRLASRVASGATSAVLTVPGDSPACALRRILLVGTAPDATESARAWATSLSGRFDGSVVSVRPDLSERGFWSGLRGSAPLLGERDAAELAAMVERERFDLVVVGLPGAADGREATTRWVERLRRTMTVPTLSVRGRSRAPRQVTAARLTLADEHELALEQSA